MNKEEYLAKLGSSERPVVLDFWAAWCMPCRAMEPAVKRVEDEYRGRVDLWRIDTDKEPEVAQAFGILGIPTLLAVHNGKEIARKTGTQSEPVVRALFDAALSGIEPQTAGIRPVERAIRLAVGLALIGFAALPGFSWLWAVPGAVICFSAVYDRCPIWKAITNYFKQKVT